MRRPDVTPAWKDRLPSAALALSLQVALFALLIYSLVPPPPPPPPPSDAVTETIFLMPKLMPPRAPIVIDARPQESTPPQPVTPPAPPSDWSPPLYATPQFDLPYAPPIPGSPRALLMALQRGLNCLPDEQGRVSALCPRDFAKPPPPRDRALAGTPGRNEARFAAENACADGPAVLPGGTPLGILFNVFTNPTVFADKRAYCAPLPPPKVDSVERNEQILRQIYPPLLPAR